MEALEGREGALYYKVIYYKAIYYKFARVHGLRRVGLIYARAAPASAYMRMRAPYISNDSYDRANIPARRGPFDSVGTKLPYIL